MHGAALHGGQVVGAIGTRLERQTTPTAPQQLSRLYIMTLGVLPSFRGHGIGAPLEPRPQPLRQRPGTMSRCLVSRPALLACAAVDGVSHAAAGSA